MLTSRPERHLRHLSRSLFITKTLTRPQYWVFQNSCPPTSELKRGGRQEADEILPTLPLDDQVPFLPMGITFQYTARVCWTDAKNASNKCLKIWFQSYNERILSHLNFQIVNRLRVSLNILIVKYSKTCLKRNAIIPVFFPVFTSFRFTKGCVLIKQSTKNMVA